MTPTQITSIAAVVLSVLFEYVPGLNTWYNKLKDTNQRLFMLALLVIVVVGAFGLSCAHWLTTAWPCTSSGLKEAASAFALAIAANQGTYVILPKKASS